MAIRTFAGQVPELGDFVYIDETALVIGAVKLQEQVSIWPGAVLRGDVNTISIGKGTNVQDGCVLHVSHDGKYSPGGFPLIIGKGVTIGHRAVVHACQVGDYCLLGIGAVILDGAVLEDYVMLGAGTLVPPGRRLLSGHLYVGSPAKQVRKLSTSEKEFLEYSSQHYMQLKDRYLNQEWS